MGDAYISVLSFGGHMSKTSGQSIRIILALSVTATALTSFSIPARAGGERDAIAAGIAGGVAGTMAGQALSGTMPPPGYPPPVQQDCVWEQQMVQQPYHIHIGQVRVCQ
jgi:hypothetical protein